jgi:type VI secretion system secreted protein VgrG
VDFADWPKGGESVPLRLAKPFAGKLQTGMHFVALDNDEAVISFRDGDPDKPEITAFHHHSQARDLVTNDRRWLSRNVIRTQANNKVRFEDWAGQEGIKVSTEHSGKSQLNLGYLANNKLEYRGEGYELRSSGWGALRAGKGVMVTTYDRPGASGKQLDMQETIAQLESALATAKALAASASSAKAEPADTDAQQQMKQHFDGLKKPALLMSTPASAGIVAGGGVQLSAQDNINTVAGKNADGSVLKRFTVAAGEMISLFAQKLGFKAFAAQGPVEIQAQSGPLSFIADKDINVASVNGRVSVVANKELILEWGGAFIHMKDGSITLGGPFDLFLKTITVQKKGKASLQIPVPDMPHGDIGPFSQKLTFRALADGSRMSDVPYKLFTQQEDTASFKLANQGSSTTGGSTRTTNPDSCDTAESLFGEGEWGTLTDQDIARNDLGTGGIEEWISDNGSEQA